VEDGEMLGGADLFIYLFWDVVYGAFIIVGFGGLLVLDILTRLSG